MEIVEKISALALPSVILLVALIVLFGKRDYFSHFLSGAREGGLSAVRLMPTMCALVVAISMLSASGATEALAKLAYPLFDFLGIPPEIATMLLIRPFSGSGALASFSEIISELGPDSLPSLCASVIFASSDTFVYVLCVYFSNTQIKKTRHALPICITVSVFSVFLSCVLTRLFFE